MIVAGEKRRGAYYDSVTLMQCGKRLTAIDGVLDAAVVMGTKANRAILQASGLWAAEFTDITDADLLIVVKGETEQSARAALAAVDGMLKQSGQQSGEGEQRPASIAGAVKVLPGANLALISVAGRYAGAEARKALESGLHVMLFSDNVSLETEVELKRLARDQGLLLMGPDCGTAIINGVPLGFANVVRRGDIGIVAAAGTGLQEVSCIISQTGAGISQAIGTGGRDVKKEVGGIMFLEALKALAADDETRVILLVAKPPDAEVLEQIMSAIAQVGKPVVPMFVGAATWTLEQAALTAVEIAKGADPLYVMKQLAARDAAIQHRAARQAARRKPGQKYVRGLFSGGTFCAEAQVLLAELPGGIYSNAPTGRTQELDDPLKSQANTLIDLGEDEFTVGRPHPMIDHTLRNRRIRREADDSETAVILLDVILGFGAHTDPAGEMEGVVREASQNVSVVCSVTGTDEDPQERSEVVKRLQAAGAVVMPSNAAACKLAGYIVQALTRRSVAANAQ